MNQQIHAVVFGHRFVGAFGRLVGPIIGLAAKRVANAATLPICNKSQLGEILVPVPPKAEQEEIARFVYRETARIDTLTDKVREAIDRLREYRTALISAAVTGKIDVRDAA